MNDDTAAAVTRTIARVVGAICAAHPNTQAIYLYGTWGTAHRRPDSDIDIAVLLPPAAASIVDRAAWSRLATELAATAKMERADLVNVRAASTLLCKEVIAADRRIYCADTHAADEFEMLTLSFYQKLNEERRGIIESGLRGGRFYHV